MNISDFGKGLKDSIQDLDQNQNTTRNEDEKGNTMDVGKSNATYFSQQTNEVTERETRQNSKDFEGIQLNSNLMADRKIPAFD